MHQEHIQETVLIVPLWNWNSRNVATVSIPALRSNRTFMELKLGKADDDPGNEAEF